jgi:hypothetical protein
MILLMESTHGEPVPGPGSRQQAGRSGGENDHQLGSWVVIRVRANVFTHSSQNFVAK